MSKVATEGQVQSAEIEEPEQGEAAPSLKSLIKAVSDKLNADIYLYSGPLERGGASQFIDIVEQYKAKDNGALILTTYGGTADAAYKVVRHLKRRYENRTTLYVFGPCKSAGTLLALGVNEIVMSCAGELGPLDVQLLKRDDLFFRNSGLDITEALRSISEHAFSLFEKQFIETLMRSGGAVSTKTASEIAEAIAIGLLSPITSQIDPLQIGEVLRAVKVAEEYAKRLKADHRAIEKLVKGYPSHTFVIDFEEAKNDLNLNVRLAEPLEEALAITLAADSTVGTGHDCVREPYPHDVIVMPVSVLMGEESDETEEGNTVSERSNGGDPKADAGEEPRD